MAPTKKDETGVTADVFFNGPEGFGEHIQISAPDVVTLIEERAKVIETLKAAGATPRWQDEKRGPVTPAERAVRDVNGPAPFSGVSQDLPQSSPCPVDGKPMVLIATGRGGQPLPYGPFYSCDMQAGGCGKKVNAKSLRK